MSGVQISYHASDQALRAHLARLAQFDTAGKNEGKRVIGVYMIGEVQDHFNNQTLWDDSAMPQSAAAKARGGQTLIDNHNLYDSYHPDVSGDDIIIGSDSIYAAIHHEGGDAGRNHASHIDARPVLGVNPRNERDIIDEVVSILVRYE